MFEKIAKWVDSIPIWFLALIAAMLLTVALLITVMPQLQAEAAPPVITCTCKQEPGRTCMPITGTVCQYYRHSRSCRTVCMCRCIRKGW